jgi:VWFA-related protein
MSRLAAICFLLVAAQTSLAQKASPPAPAEILARVSSVYASCRSYSDEGETSTITGPIPARTGPRPMLEHFSTAFVRPDAFRFEFLMGPPLMNPTRSLIAWKAGPVEKSFSFNRFDSNQDALSEMLMRMTAPSHSAALTVPALLMPGLFHGKGLFASLTDLKLGREEKIGGRRAWRIEAKLDFDPFNLWIDANDFTILQVEQVNRFGTSEQYTSTRYRPVLNGAIAQDKLAFNAPGMVEPDPSADAPVRTAPELKTNVRPRLKNFGSSAYLTSEEIERLTTQRERQSEDEDIVRVNTDMVVTDVLVIDAQGRPIQGLEAKDFILKEDDQPQEIGSLSLGNSDQVPRSIVLVIDYSNSQLPYVVTSVEAAKTLVDKLRPRDRMALVTDDVKLLVDFTADKQVLKAQLDALKQRAMSGYPGRSLQYDAMMATLTELFSREEERPIVIFQTDGDQLDALGKVPTSAPALRPYLSQDRKFSFEDLLTAAERARVTIYSIIPGVQMIGFSGEELISRSKIDLDNRMKAQEELWRLRNLPVRPPLSPSDEQIRRNAERWSHLHLGVIQLAKASGGWADYLEKPEQADWLYAHVLNDINQRYVIAYYPKNRTRDGKRRRLSIVVRGHPEYIILGRRSYFAPLP